MTEEPLFITENHLKSAPPLTTLNMIYRFTFYVLNLIKLQTPDQHKEQKSYMYNSFNTCSHPNHTRTTSSFETCSNPAYKYDFNTCSHPAYMWLWHLLPPSIDVTLAPAPTQYTCVTLTPAPTQHTCDFGTCSNPAYMWLWHLLQPSIHVTGTCSNPAYMWLWHLLPPSIHDFGTCSNPAYMWLWHLLPPSIHVTLAPAPTQHRCAVPLRHCTCTTAPSAAPSTAPSAAPFTTTPYRYTWPVLSTPTPLYC